jgi:biotin transporter BioY
MKQFLKLTKEKINITISLIILSFIFYLINTAIMSLIIRSKTLEEMNFFSMYVFPAVANILMIIELYLVACLAVYLVDKFRNKSSDLGG